MIDTRYANSSGYFKDPVTGEDLSVDTPRVIQCELRDGKFIWPQVAVSDGSALIKIVYKYFTEEEKSLYKQYRGYGESKPRVKQHVPDNIDIDDNSNLDDEPVKEKSWPESHNKYDLETAMSDMTEKYLDDTERFIGICNIGGLYYAMLKSKTDKRKVYYVPRSEIPDNIFTALCNGVKYE